MVPNATRFENFLAQEIDKYKDVTVPRKSGFLRRHLVRHAPVKKLHPNPGDEFCDRKIGPNYSIISEYEQELREYGPGSLKEPLYVERMYPDGYLILNGHHRWAAAIRANIGRLPVSVVNPTHEADVREMLRNARHDKRVALDLDEVLLASGPEDEKERPLPFPLNRHWPEQLRRGVPALIHGLKKQGYDIWVYTQSYRSMEHVRLLFRLYHVAVDGVVTGLARKAKMDESHRQRLESLVAARYPRTVHIDRDSVLCIDKQTRTYEEYPLARENWSRQVMDVIGGLDHDKAHGPR